MVAGSGKGVPTVPDSLSTSGAIGSPLASPREKNDFHVSQLGPVPSFSQLHPSSSSSTAHRDLRPHNEQKERIVAYRSLKAVKISYMQMILLAVQVAKKKTESAELYYFSQ